MLGLLLALPLLVFRGNVALVEDVYRSVLELPANTKATPANARSVAQRLRRFLHNAGYSLATVAAHAQGAVVVTSNVMPVLWRIEPAKAQVTKHELMLDADTDKDVGFTGLTYAPDQGVFFGVSATYGSLWRIDPLLRRAQKIQSSAPLNDACGLSIERVKTRRIVVLCARGGPNAGRVHLAPDQRSAYVRSEPCLGLGAESEIAYVK